MLINLYIYKFNNINKIMKTDFIFKQLSHFLIFIYFIKNIFTVLTFRILKKKEPQHLTYRI